MNKTDKKANNSKLIKITKNNIKIIIKNDKSKVNININKNNNKKKNETIINNTR